MASRTINARLSSSGMAWNQTEGQKKRASAEALTRRDAPGVYITP
jgi:hypothetical protein